MSGFCVFGVSLLDCKKKAEKKLSPFDIKGNRVMTNAEYANKVGETAKSMFDKPRMARQISPAFDSPKFAQEWADLGIKSNVIRSAKIMVRGKKLDKRGGPVKNKKGVDVITWVPYEG